ncbi:MAG: alpha-L-fucosidase 1 [Stygiobacter sp.]|nr:MAG: alpha-L-fucosidase 1 [Stygiobacter sp.]KAF0216975.1 MAG: alpha-L-fucosidase [Ignavibacteria bacterium]
MKHSYSLPFTVFLWLAIISSTIENNIVLAQQTKLPGNYVQIDAIDSKDEILKKAANVTPSKIQYEWQKLEFTAFIHFGINTFYDAEWGRKDYDISKFNPTELDVNQWTSTLKAAGVKLVLLTTKHHDGFCLWQTKLTDYSIANTPFQNGKSDIVRDLSIACKRAGLKFGVYLSPWDMHEPTYGTDEYNKYFVNQLTELLTNYGEIAEVWFDGACGEGTNGKKQVYDWQSYYKTIRKLQPNAVIAIMGPDVRWVGTESGYGRKTEWSVLPGSSSSQSEIADNSQQQKLDAAFVPRDLMNEDLGSREKIYAATSLIWYPAEIDVSIRNGWFYHTHDDGSVKSPEKLVDIYYNSVGLNGVLLLNIPPDKRGLIHENDVKALRGMKKILDETFSANFARNASADASSTKKGLPAKNILDDNLETYWSAEENVSQASIELTFEKEQKFNTAMLQENVLIGQRIEKFHLEYWNGLSWKTFVEGTTVGYKRLLRFSAITADRIRIVIDESRLNPTLASFGLYLAPETKE